MRCNRCGVDAGGVDPVSNFGTVGRCNVYPETEGLLGRRSGLGRNLQVEHLRGELLVDDLVGNLLFGLPLQGLSVHGRRGRAAIAGGVQQEIVCCRILFGDCQCCLDYFA